MKMDEEIDIAKSLAGALREVKLMREGKIPETSWEDAQEEIARWLAEVE